VLGVAKNGVPFRLFSLFSFFGTPKNGASLSPNAVWNNVKRWSKPTAELTKTKEKLKNPQEPNAQAP
jgi:hypothetical protein